MAIFKRKQRGIRLFSLIEVAIGAAIITAGATAAVLLLPIGLRENMDSSGRNFTASAIQTIKAYIQSQITSITFDEFVKDIPDVYPTNDSFKLNTSIYSSNPDDIHLNCLQEAMNKEGFFKITYKNNNNDAAGAFVAEVVIWHSVDIKFNSSTGYIETDTIATNSDNIKSGSFSNSQESGGIAVSNAGISDLTPIGEIPEGDEATSISLGNDDFTGTFNFEIAGLALTLNSSTVKSITLTAANEEEPFNFTNTGGTITGLAGNIKIAVEFATADLTSDKGNSEITGANGMSYFYTTIDEADPQLIGYGLNVEISWPIEKPHMAREKAYYYFEIYKQ